MQRNNHSSVIIYACFCVYVKLILNHNHMENTLEPDHQYFDYGLAIIRFQVITWNKIAKIVRIWHYEQWVGNLENTVVGKG